MTTVKLTIFSSAIAVAHAIVRKSLQSVSPRYGRTRLNKISLLGLVAALAAATCMSASAATFACNNAAGIPNSTLVAYNFDVSVAVSSGGGGGGAGKATTSLVVQLPLDASYPALYTQTVDGKRSSSCVLTETLGKSVTATLSNVIFSDLKLLNGNYYTNYTPGPVVQLTLAYEKIDIK